MKLVKTFGLAVLGVLMAMAFLSASSAIAGATAICKADEQNGCAAANRVRHLHLTTLSGSKAKLLRIVNNQKEVITECDVLFLGEMLDSLTGAGTEYIIHGHFTYTNCTNSCSAAELTGTDSLIKLLRTANDEGVVTGEGEVEVTCLFFSCTYNGEGLTGVARGYLFATEINGQVKIEDQELSLIKGFACPNPSYLDITVTPLERLWITP